VATGPRSWWGDEEKGLEEGIDEFLRRQGHVSGTMEAEVLKGWKVRGGGGGGGGGLEEQHTQRKRLMMM